MICLVPLYPPTAGAASQLELCDKALSVCEQRTETLEKLRAKDNEIVTILQDQRDKAVRNQGASLGEKIEYGVIGGAAALVIYFLIHSNK